MGETPAETVPDGPMREGMEGLIAAMKDRRPAPREPDIGSDSTLLRGDDSDSLAAEPWDAVALDGADPPPVLERGAVIGRYVVLQQLGAGGMGVVYAAYDPELDRKLALKLLLPGAMGPSGRTRLLREAQALAQLSHPNVVAIHDVGTVGEQVWLAMELVQGQTLSKWLATPRRWQEVLAVMLEAGRGLAAAHAVPLLHRDFKPDNVMVGDDGRMRVMDFGLARGRSRTTLVGDEEPVVPALDMLGMQVTRAGAIVGTPSYMAPEQFGGAELTAAADQFAFCVTLWEALYGERPFGGSSWMELAAHVLGGRLRPPSNPRAAPTWLRRVCERGLAVDPGQRWPSMLALLETLAKGRTRARVRTGLATLGVLALLGAGIEGNRRYDLAQRTAACEANGDEIATAWNPEREQALRNALLATGASYAATTADKTMPWLEQQAEAWRQARVEACLDADVRGTWNAETLDRSLWCLDERRMELESLVDELTLADAEVLQKAVPAASWLAPVAPCRNARVLAALGPPPAQDREAIREVRASLTQVDGLRLTGRYKEGIEPAQAALARAMQLGWQPLSAAARLHLGLVLDDTGAYAEAETMLEDAYFEAAEGVAPEVALWAAVGLVRVVSEKLARHADALRWGRFGEAAVAALPEGGRLPRMALLQNLANVHNRAGDHDQARTLYEQALSIAEAELGPDHPSVATTISGLAVIHQKAGRSDEARVLHERALAIREHALGSDQPLVASSLNNLAALHQATGDYEGAKALLARALAIREHTQGPEHPLVADTLANLGLLHHQTGADAEARAFLERVLAIRTKTLGPEHPKQADTHHNLGLIAYTAGSYDEARVHYQRALAIREKVLGPEHLDVASLLSNLALVDYETGDLEAARTRLERALAIDEEILGPQHPIVAGVLGNLADVRWHTDARDEAEALYARALAISEQALGPDDPSVALSLGRLARARQWRGAHAEAEALYGRELAIYEKRYGPDHLHVAEPLTSLAELALARDGAAEAIALARRAVEIRERVDVAGDLLAYSRHVLARALWDAPPGEGRDRVQAMALATQARDAMRGAGEGPAARLAEVEAWLAERTEDESIRASHPAESDSQR